MSAREIDHDCTGEPVCPHCGHAHQDAFEWSDEGTRNCHKCRKPFKWEREVEVTYSTEAVLVEGNAE
jgi:hypothetical protein